MISIIEKNDYSMSDPVLKYCTSRITDYICQDATQHLIKPWNHHRVPGLMGCIPIENMRLSHGLMGCIPNENMRLSHGLMGCIPSENMRLSHGLMGCIPIENMRLSHGLMGCIPSENMRLSHGLMGCIPIENMRLSQQNALLNEVFVPSISEAVKMYKKLDGNLSRNSSFSWDPLVVNEEAY